MKKEIDPIPSTATSLVRNTAYNLFSQGVFVILALWAIPILIAQLGDEQFGLFTLVWSLIGYFSLLDFGISRANTKYLSEAIAKNDSDEVPKVVWTSLISTLILGIISSIFIILFTPFAVESIFNIQVEHRAEAIKYFMISGIGIPFLILFGTLKGFQMALQRFDLVNIYQIITGVIQWGGSVLLLKLNYGLEEIIILTVGIRIVLALFAFGTLHKILPNIFKNPFAFEITTLKKLWSFGGWISISQIISPLFIYIDRFFIGIFLSLSAVAYYSVPQEAMTRVLILVISFTATLFPVVSAESTQNENRTRIGFLYERSLKYVTLMMIPFTVVFVLLSNEILTVWLGEDFAKNSIVVFQILAVGLLFNAVAQIPTTMLHAFGRPDLTAKFHLAEFLVVIVLNIVLIPIFGIVGAAMAWSLRVLIDAVLLFSATQRHTVRISLFNGFGISQGKIPFLFLLILFQIIVYLMLNSHVEKVISVISFFILYMAITWFHSFDNTDRTFFLQLRSKIFY